MDKPKITHILFDFFGTLVAYSPSRTEQGYERSYALIENMGCSIGYAEFLHLGDDIFASFEKQSLVHCREFSMMEACSAVLKALLKRSPSAEETAKFVGAYLADWNKGVRYVDKTVELIRSLSADYVLAIVSNTHHAQLVPDHLAAMRIDHLFETVVLSVEVGWRKPHPLIYQAAVDRLGVTASQVAFVGDTFEADFDGPRDFGMRAFLIDPDHRYDLTDDVRLDSVFDLPSRLRRP